MNTITKLSDFSIEDILELSFKHQTNNYLGVSYKEHAPLVKKVYDKLVKQNLRFNNSNGNILDNTGIIEYFSNPSDFEPHNNKKDILLWEFKRYLGNGLSYLLSI